MAIFNAMKLVTIAAFIPGLLAVIIGNDDPTTNQGLLGDLLTNSSTPTTNAGFLIKAWLLHQGSALAANDKLPIPASCGTATPDVCCPWWPVSDDLTALFLDPTTGECTDDARAAIRLGFHDAASYSKKADMAGSFTSGADGSMLLFREDQRKENNGLQDIVSKLAVIQANRGVGAADLIQFANQHATVTCPQGPRIVFFAGRKDSTQAAPPNLVPDVHDTAQNLIDLMMDKTINAQDLTALLGAHSAAKEFHVDVETPAGIEIDTTPGIWDTGFYNETLQESPSPGVFRFPSDDVLSKSENMTAIWQGFVGQQAFWNAQYALAYTRLSVLGVNNIDQLVDCSGALPSFVASAPGGIEKLKVRSVRFH
jgi:hypothetical protein